MPVPTSKSGKVVKDDFFAHATLLNALETVAPLSGAGSPEGVVTAVPGRMYLNSDGGAGTTLYVKESGTGATGWVAK